MRRSVLLIEDNEGDIELVRMVFKLLEPVYDLIVYTDGASAYQALKEKEILPQIIILDLNLPGLHGTEFIEKVRSLSIPRCLIPICVLSTSKAQVDIEKTYLLGANSFIAKPLNFNSFKTLLESTLHYWLEMVENPINPGN